MSCDLMQCHVTYNTNGWSCILLVHMQIDFHCLPRAVGRSQRKGVLWIWRAKCGENFLKVNYIHYGRGQLIRLIRLQRDLRNAKNGTSGIETSSKT